MIFMITLSILHESAYEYSNKVNAFPLWARKKQNLLINNF